MRKQISILILLLIAFAGASAATTAADVLALTADKITKARSITAEYSISAASSKDKGTLILASGKFTLTSASLRTWYDGITLWTYSPQLGEVNISHPTADELMEINPFAIISNYKKQYNASFAKTKSANSYNIILTPKKGMKSVFSKAAVTIDPVTYYPTSIILTLPDRSVVDIDVESVTTGNIISQRTFMFDESLAPGAEIIDLR